MQTQCRILPQDQQILLRNIDYDEQFNTVKLLQTHSSQISIFITSAEMPFSRFSSLGLSYINNPTFIIK